MGYNTDFEGRLDFVEAPDYEKLNKFLGEDRRNLGYYESWDYDGGKYGKFWYHIDLELTDDMMGLQWNGAEKTYDLEHIVNFLIDQCGLMLKGKLCAQGDEHGDTWELVIKDGRAVKVEV